MSSASLPKVQIVPGSTENSATFLLNGEDHTLGNALRYVLMRHKLTVFCGYSMPHPSEAVVNIRLQTQKRSAVAAAERSGDSAMQVFREGTQSLISITNHIGAVFDEALDAADAPAASMMKVDDEAEVVTTKKKKGGAAKR